MSKSIILAFLIAAFITLLSRLKHMIDNPDEILRHENGEINWKYNIFVNAVELIIGRCCWNRYRNSF